jgi:hypothetical protein
VKGEKATADDERTFASLTGTDLTYLIPEGLKGCRALPSPSKNATNVEIGMVSPEPFRGDHFGGVEYFQIRSFTV